MLKDILGRQRENGYAGFRGASVKGHIPLRESLINEAAQEGIAMQGGGTAAFTLHKISVLDNNIVAINATVKKWVFSQTLNVELALDPIVDFPRDPTLRLRPARSLGLLGVLMEIFSAAFPLPDFVTFASQTVSINLKAALEKQGYADLVPLMQYVGITSRPGTLFIDFRIAVP